MKDYGKFKSHCLYKSCIFQILSAGMTFKGLSEWNLNLFKCLQIISNFVQHIHFPPLALSSKPELSTCWRLAGVHHSDVNWSFFLSANNTTLTNPSWYLSVVVSVVRLYEENKTWNTAATIVLRYLIWHWRLFFRNYQVWGNEESYHVRSSLAFFPSPVISRWTFFHDLRAQISFLLIGNLALSCYFW